MWIISKRSPSWVCHTEVNTYGMSFILRAVGEFDISKAAVPNNSNPHRRKKHGARANFDYLYLEFIII